MTFGSVLSTIFNYLCSDKQEKSNVFIRYEIKTHHFMILFTIQGVPKRFIKKNNDIEQLKQRKRTFRLQFVRYQRNLRVKLEHKG